MRVAIRCCVGIWLAAACVACGGGDGPSAPQTGSLHLIVTGLVDPITLVVSGPNLPDLAVAGGFTLKNLTPGVYTVTAHPVMEGTKKLAPSPLEVNVSVAASSTATDLTIAYELANGPVQFLLQGIPAGYDAPVYIDGPYYYSFWVARDTLLYLDAGSYTVVAATLPDTIAKTTYGSLPASRSVNVAGSLVPDTVRVTYATMTAQLKVTVNGLPAGGASAITVVGPFGYSHAITAQGATTLSGLPLGGYHVNAASVTAAGKPFWPDTVQRFVALGAGLDGVATVAYNMPDLRIDGMYVAQETQTYAGDVPLITGKDAMVRVFVRMNLDNTLAPKVRLRWYAGAALIRTDISAPLPVPVPLSINQGVWANSINMFVPGSLIQPGISLLADVDPDLTSIDGDRTNNMFPVNGTPIALDVRTVPPFDLMLVPVLMTGGSLNVDLTPANQNTYVMLVKRMYPVNEATTTRHADYTAATGLPLQANDSNGVWEKVLGEMAALRVAESAPDSRYYYGVVDPQYNSGVAGIGIIGYPVGIGWDKPGFYEVSAHEIGHMLNRRHSPCGGAADPDPNYPYPRGEIGVYGVYPGDPSLEDSGSVYDIMSYCGPKWVSDFTFNNILTWRLSLPSASALDFAPPEPSLLLWGTVRGSVLELEPAFELTARPRPPEGTGPYTLQGLSASGGVLFSYQFAAREIADGRPGARNFAFTVPLSLINTADLAEIRLSGFGGEARMRSAAVASGRAPSPTLANVRKVGGRADFDWDHRSYPMAMVRDRATGQVLSFARGGHVRVSRSDLMVTLSDGVKSVTIPIAAK